MIERDELDLGGPFGETFAPKSSKQRPNYSKPLMKAKRSVRRVGEDHRRALMSLTTAWEADAR